MCIYDAMIYEGNAPKTNHVYDMSKCTYPKCTLCVDHCLMNCIDFSTRPPTIHHDCEGCDVCWCVCPHDAISISNLAQTHLRLAQGRTSALTRNLDVYEAAGRFRRLVPLDKIGIYYRAQWMNKNAPRIVLNENDEATYCDKPCKV
jgi:ferredoxin